jgi:hypothetical protein
MIFPFEVTAWNGPKRLGTLHAFGFELGSAVDDLANNTPAPGWTTIRIQARGQPEGGPMTIEETTERPTPPVNKGWLHYGLSRLAGVSIYYAVGAFAHVEFYRRDFARDDLLSWAWIGGWPLGLLLLSLKWIMLGTGVLLALIVVGLLGYFLWKLVGHLWFRWVIWPRDLRRAERESSPL